MRFPFGQQATRLGLLAGLGAVVAFIPSAHAQPGDAQASATAESLFREAKDLMAQENFAAACAKFEASQSLEAGLGTLLNLADCYEKLGRTASAWAEFLRAAALARRSDQRDREDVARERARALEPLLLRLKIVVPAEALASGLTIHRGSVEVERAAWGSPIPVDPGSYVVKSSAPGKVPREYPIELNKPGETVELALMPLEDAPVTETPPEAAPVAAAPPPPPAPEPRAVTVSPPPESSQRTWGLALGGVGVAGLAAGGILGLVAKNRYDDAQCENGLCPSSSAQRDSERALKLANYGTISAAAGGALLVVGATIYLLAPGNEETSPAVGALTWAPLVSADTGGIWLAGGF